MKLCFKKYFSNQWHNDKRSISQKAIVLNIVVHGMINLLYYKRETYYITTDQQKNLSENFYA